MTTTISTFSSTFTSKSTVSNNINTNNTNNNNNMDPTKQQQQQQEKLQQQQNGGSYCCSFRYWIVLIMIGCLMAAMTTTTTTVEYLQQTSTLDFGTTTTNKTNNANKTMTMSIKPKLNNTSTSTLTTSTTTTSKNNNIDTTSSNTTSSSVNPTSTTSTTQPIHLWWCGYPWPNLIRHLFPESEGFVYKGSFADSTNPTINLRNAAAAMDMSNNNTTHNLDYRHDIMIYGMHGPCGKSLTRNVRHEFFGKILFVNGEPNGQIQIHSPQHQRPNQPRINNDIYQISGPISTKEEEQQQQHKIKVFHAANILVDRFTKQEQEWIFDPHQRQKWLPATKALQQQQQYDQNTTMMPTNVTTTNVTTTTEKVLLPPGGRIIYVSSHCMTHRETMATMLSNHFPVDAGGKCQGTLGDGNQIHKISIPGNRGQASHGLNWKLYGTYKYCLVMENESIEGYISEKLLYAFMGGCLPIYWGFVADVVNVFNVNAFILINNTAPTSQQQQQDALLKELHYLESNDTAYLEKLSQPILATTTMTTKSNYNNDNDTTTTTNSSRNEEIINRYFSLSDEIGDGSLKRKIRTMMGV